ncbi:MAG: hypothetical protein ABI376_02930 [Caulobacteraceae bacterium]
MILRRLMMALAAAAAFAASAAVLVVALAFALYAWIEPWLGRAGAAAIVALVAALLIAATALFMVMATRRKHPAPVEAMAGNVAERVFAFVRQKPVMAISAALGAGFLAVRNPRYLGSAVRAFLEGRRPTHR